MSYQGKITADHDEIRRWAEARGGRPAAVRSAGAPREPEILCIDFSDRGPDESLEYLSWESFFAKFDEHHLALLYQERTAEGGPSRFYKFIGRETARERRAA